MTLSPSLGCTYFCDCQDSHIHQPGKESLVLRVRSQNLSPLAAGQKSWGVVALISLKIKFRRIRTEPSISNEGRGVSFLALEYLSHTHTQKPCKVANWSSMGDWEGQGKPHTSFSSHSPRDQRLRQLSWSGRTMSFQNSHTGFRENQRSPGLWNQTNLASNVSCHFLAM